VSRFAVVASAADTSFNASYTPDNAFDERFSGAANERWSPTTGALPHWLRADLGTAKVAHWYRVDPGRAGSDPTAWTFQGTNDATFATWTTLDTQTAQSFAASQTKTYQFTNTTAYRWYRIHITAAAASAGSIAELEIGDNPPPACTWEHIPATSNQSGNFTIGLLHVINTTIEITHVLVYVGNVTASWEGRVRNAAGTIIASATVAAGSTETGWREVALASPVIATPQTVLVESYNLSGQRYAIRSGGTPPLANYGIGGEVTVPADGTVSFRGNSLNARQSAGNAEPTAALGQQPMVGIKFQTPTATAHELEGVGGNTATAGTGAAIRNDSVLEGDGSATVWSGTGAAVRSETGLVGDGGDTAWTGTGAAAETERVLGGVGGSTLWSGTGAALGSDSDLSGTGGSTVWNGSGAALDAPPVAAHDLVGAGGLTQWTGTLAALTGERVLIGTGGLTEWLGEGARIRHPEILRDVVVTGITLFVDRTTFLETTDQRAIIVTSTDQRSTQIRSVDMDLNTVMLHPKERIYYTLVITTVPAAVGDWDLSVDGGQTWHAGTDLGEDKFQWLISGADFVPEVGDAIPSIKVSRALNPLVRLRDTPEVVIESAPAIRIG
jgi:hypothetical protein